MTLDPEKDHRRAEKAGDGASEGQKKKEEKKRKSTEYFPVLIKTLVHIICNVSAKKRYKLTYALRHFIAIAYCP